MTDERLPHDFQLDMLALMIDAEEFDHADHLAEVLNPQDFDNRILREIFTKVQHFINNHGSCPFNSLETELADKLDSKPFAQIVNNLYDRGQVVNEKADWILKYLQKFKKTQSAKALIMEFSQKLLDGDDPDIVMSQMADRYDKITRTGQSQFDGGLDFGKTEDIAKLIEYWNRPVEFTSGLEQFDNMSAVPARKTLYMAVGGAKVGKSWYLLHLAKSNMMKRRRVLFVSLEMSREEVGLRLVQAMHTAVRGGKAREVKWITHDAIFKEHEHSVMADGLGTALHRQLKRAESPHTRPLPIRIVDAPAGLTVQGLKRQIRRMERKLDWKPDMVVVDYLDLFRPEQDYGEHRLNIGQIGVQLRQLASELDVAVCTATQANREGMKSRKIQVEHVAEDISKVQTADLVIGMSQSETERDIKGVLRMSVIASRSTPAGLPVVVTQSIDTGNFCAGSRVQTEDYKVEGA